MEKDQSLTDQQGDYSKTVKQQMELLPNCTYYVLKGYVLFIADQVSFDQ